MRLIDQIAQAIDRYEGTHGFKPDYVMLHPERMAWVWREIGEMMESGEIRGTPTGKEPRISNVPLKESIFAPLRNTTNSKDEYAFFLMLDPMRRIGGDGGRTSNDW